MNALKFSTTLVLLMTCSLLAAQMEKNTIFAGLGLSLVVEPDIAGRLNQNTMAGVLIDNMFAIGARTSSSDVYDFRRGFPDSYSTDYSLLGRFYFPGSERISPFFSLEAGVGLHRVDYDNDLFDQRTVSWILAGGGGLNWFVTPTAGFEAALYFHWRSEENVDPEMSLRFDITPQLLFHSSKERLGAAAKTGLGAGKLMLGGGGSMLWDISEETDKPFVLRMEPVVGYMIGAHWMAGAELLLGLDKPENRVDFNWGLSPFIRFYVNPNSTFKLFGMAMAGLRTVETSDFLLDLQPSLGLAHFLTSNLALEAVASYRTTKLLDEPGDWNEILLFNFGVKIFLDGSGSGQ
jgi:hypothetical protein